MKERRHCHSSSVPLVTLAFEFPFIFLSVFPSFRIPLDHCIHSVRLDSVSLLLSAHSHHSRPLCCTLNAMQFLSLSFTLHTPPLLRPAPTALPLPLSQPHTHNGSRTIIIRATAAAATADALQSIRGFSSPLRSFYLAPPPLPVGSNPLRCRRSIFPGYSVFHSLLLVIPSH